MKYSIAIPAYKATFLFECIDSVLSQSFTDFELIIVDDASPYNLDKIVSRFHDSRIRYYKNKENCGAINVVDNWNICLSYARGEYFICMGDDDKLLPNCLEIYNELIDEYPDLDVYHGFAEIIDEHSSIMTLQVARPKFESVYSLMWHRWNGRVQFIGDFLFRTVALRKEGGFFKLPLAWGSDEISGYRAACSKGIANTQIPVFQYRRNSQTISNTGNVVIKIGAVRLEEQWSRETLDSLHPQSYLDKSYKSLMLKEMHSYFKIKIYNLLVKDAQYGSWFQPFSWFFHFKKLKVPVKVLIKASLVSFKNKLVHQIWEI